ncbi:hypothetical protein PFL603g_04853 [Pseudomonas fluorescens]|uniref:Uncharacterized protein n=1 Tax=Pseudomonas fluorescens TaxID=294 RepID=A0A109KLL4_PSEFL|nr:hypothetical protein PFL603g_04853 [Pseudomonas fluorescens]
MRPAERQQKPIEPDSRSTLSTDGILLPNVYHLMAPGVNKRFA